MSAERRSVRHLLLVVLVLIVVCAVAHLRHGAPTNVYTVLIVLLGIAGGALVMLDEWLDRESASERDEAEP